jgi:RimJ/RimL family protein N-acetyltransferase
VSHVLRTERLVLRPVTTQDHARLLAHWTAPDVRRFLFDGAVLSPEEITGAIGDSAPRDGDNPRARTEGSRIPAGPPRP